MQRDSQGGFCTKDRRLDTASPPAPRPAATGRDPGWDAKDTAILLVLLAAPAMAVLDGFVVLVALPSIQFQLRASDAAVQLVIAGYGLAYAALLIAAGRLGDLYGRRRLLVAGVMTFGGTSLIAGLAPNDDVLIAARFAQGGAGAVMYPQALGLLRTIYGGRARAIAMGAYGVTLGLAAIAAPLIGGLLVQADEGGLGWRSVFLVNVPIATVAALLAARILPGRGREQSGPGVSLDMFGVVALTGMLLALVLPLVAGRQLGWPWWTWPSLAGAAVAGIAFVLHERRSAAPLIDVGLFQRRTFMVGLATTLVFYAGEVIYLVFLTIYLQRGMGLSPVPAGVMVMSVAACFSVASAALPFVAARLGRLVLTVGMLTAAVATDALMLFVLADPPVVAFVLPSLLCAGGLGFGLVIPTLVDAALGNVPPETAGVASGMVVTAQQIGGAMGVAVGGIVFFGLLGQASIDVAYGLLLGFDVILFSASLVFVGAMRDAR